MKNSSFIDVKEKAERTERMLRESLQALEVMDRMHLDSDDSTSPRKMSAGTIEESKETFGREAKPIDITRARAVKRDYYMKTVTEIARWVSNTNFVDFVNEIKAQVIGQEAVVEVVANVYNYLLNVSTDPNAIINNNMVIAAPSGCGKTQTYRALRSYFKEHIPSLPCYSFDVTQLTPTGYKGVDPIDILGPFFDRDMTNAIGIVFLDELDKKLMPSTTSNGENANYEVQSSLLTMIEGNVLRNSKLGGRSVDTNRLMFVGLGSFDHFRKQRSAEKPEIGFANEEKEAVDHYSPVSRSDMIKVGGADDFLGRFPYIVNYGKLDEESVLQIIASATETIVDSFDLGKVLLSESFVEELIEKANGEFGCRLIDSIIRDIVLKTYAKGMCDPNGNTEELPVLDMIIESSTEASYEWRAYTEEEKAEYEKYAEQAARNAYDELINSAF